MSTKERYGTLVWDALFYVTRHYAHDIDVWATVGEVAERARVSKPTAQKYLNELVLMGHAKVMVCGKQKGYRTMGWKGAQKQDSFLPKD